MWWLLLILTAGLYLYQLVKNLTQVLIGLAILTVLLYFWLGPDFLASQILIEGMRTSKDPTDYTSYEYIKKVYVSDPLSKDTLTFLTMIRDGIVMYRGCILEPDNKCNEVDIVVQIRKHMIKSRQDPSYKFYDHFLNIISQEKKIPQPQDLINYIVQAEAVENTIPQM